MRRIRNSIVVFAAAAAVFAAAGQADAGTIADVQSDEVFQAGGILNEETEGETDESFCSRRYLNTVGKAAAVSAEQVVYDGLAMASSSIDVSSYYLTREQVKDIYVSVLNENGELFYVENAWSMSIGAGDLVVEIYPQYTMAGTELEEAKELFYTETEAILSQAEDSWSDVEKALFYHDYLCTHFGYDTSYQIYDAYQFLVQKKGVCQAYTLLYGYLLKKEGIENTCASSTGMNHIWNVVSIDGSWYHVDATWDDPLSSLNTDIFGWAGHGNFLKSDIGITNLDTGEHYGWISEVSCTDSRYDDAFWITLKQPFAWAEGQWYCMNSDTSSINECDINGLALGTSVYTISDVWYAEGGGWWQGSYSGLGAYAGILYFNTPSAIYSYDPATDTTALVYEPVLSANHSLYGLYVDKNVIKYAEALSPNDSLTESGTYVLEEVSEYPDITVTVNDTEGNITCSGMDITPAGLTSYFGSDVIVYAGTLVVGETENVATGNIARITDKKTGSVISYEVIRKGDVNGDGRMDVLDMEKIQRELLNIQKLNGIYRKAGLLKDPLSESLSVLDMEMIQKYALGLIDFL